MAQSRHFAGYAAAEPEEHRAGGDQEERVAQQEAARRSDISRTGLFTECTEVGETSGASQSYCMLGT